MAVSRGTVSAILEEMREALDRVSRPDWTDDDMLSVWTQLTGLVDELGDNLTGEEVEM